jgi:hypothetical protein
MKTFLNISLCVDSQEIGTDDKDQPIYEELDDLYARLKGDLEFALEQDSALVVSITYNREAALEFVRAQKHDVEVLTKQRRLCPPTSDTVAAVLAQYNFTLPKQVKGAPDWRVPKGRCHGEVAGLPQLRGKVVLTNGIKAFLVQENETWADIHWDWFLLDKDSSPPEGIEPPKGRKVRETKIPECFLGF